MLEEQIKRATNDVVKEVGEYLLERAKTDPSVARSIEKENKSLKECFSYINGEVYLQQKENCAPMKKENVFAMAVHYYDEDNIEINALPKNMGVKTTTSIEKPVATPVKQKKEKPVTTHKKKADASEGQMALF